MHYVSLLIEFLRGRPAVVFWMIALAQSVIWTLVPTLFYSAPPGEVPLVLAIGREFVLGSYLGPPLAFWAGEIAFRFAGIFGLYALAQICIVVAYWAVFNLGRHIVGTRHAVLGVLLLIGVSSVTVPTPNFGPAVMAASFWALALLHYWRAVGERQRGNWFLLALDLGLLLLTSYVGLILFALFAVFTLSTERGRWALLNPEPWLAFILFGIIVFPHAVWLAQSRELVMAGLNESRALFGQLRPGVWLFLMFVVAHLGLVLLIVVASGWPRKKREKAPEIDRSPVSDLARSYVYAFALAPACVVVAIVFATGKFGPLDRIVPFVLLSGLAAIAAAGNRVLLHRERVVSSAWMGLLVAPPIFVVLGLFILPWTLKTDLAIAQPAGVEARFFADSFQRRTGKPLAFVTGDPDVAPLVALGSSSRPHVYFDWAPERSPWATPADLRERGAVLVWPATDSAGTPPAALKAQFPELVPEVPQSFSRPVQGFLPLIRLGWAVIRPQATTPAQ